MSLPKRVTHDHGGQGRTLVSHELNLHCLEILVIVWGSQFHPRNAGPTVFFA